MVLNVMSVGLSHYMAGVHYDVVAISLDEPGVIVMTAIDTEEG